VKATRIATPVTAPALRAGRVGRAAACGTAYGVLSHGLLTGRLGADDTGAPPHLPRLHGDNRRANLTVADRLQPIAARCATSLAQLAIAWVLAQGADQGDVVAVVGAGRPDRIADGPFLPATCCLPARTAP
jgi:aryl-alcohol dehydrogenase-like predicted oxidoreductase